MSIRKQALRHSIVNYVGVVVSFLSTLFIYNLDIELYGLVQFLTNTAFFFIPLMSLGVIGLILKFHPRYGIGFPEKSFLKTILLLYAFSSATFILFYCLFEDDFLALMQYIKLDRKGVLATYLPYVIILAIILGINRILTLHSSSLRKIVIPEVLNNLGYKLFLPIVILCGYMGWISSLQIPWILVSFFFVLGLGLFLYVRSLEGFNGRLWKWKDLDNDAQKEVRSFTLFSALNSIGGSFAFRVDMIMLSAMLGFASNGVYALLLFLSNVIDIPKKSLSKIITPILSTAAEENDVQEIEKIYQKTSITLLVPSVFITLLIWSLLPELDKIVSGNPIFYENRYLFILLAVGRLVNMLFSTNTEIIRFSPYFRYNLPFVIVLASVNVVLNYYLIDRFEILGAAMATFLAFLSYNMLKTGFLYLKMDILPFHKNTGLLLVFTLIATLCLWMIPSSWSFWLATPLKTITVLVTFALPVYYFRVSPDLNELALTLLGKVKAFRKA